MNMSRVGKDTVASVATIICMVLVMSIVLPLPALGADTEPPVTSITIGGTYNSNTGWYYTNNPVTVSLTAIDNGSGVAHTYYRLDNGAQTEYITSFTVPDGDHTLIFFSVDNAGNTEPIINGQNYLNIKVDTVAPTMNLTKKGNMVGSYYNGTATANLTASDSCSGISSISYSFSFDSGHWIAYTGNFTLPDGQYTLNYGSYDRAGNAYNNSWDFNVFNPVVSFSPASTWYDANVTVYYAGPASHDVDRLLYSYDRKTWYNTNTPGYYPIYLTTEGNITIYYRPVNDTANIIGNISSVWYGIDKSGPTIGCSIDGSRSSSGWWDGDITVHINANDKGGINHTEWSWDNSHWNNYGGPFGVSHQSSKTIYYRTTDMMGRTATGSTWIYFAPGSYNQGSMSDSVWINGVLYGPSSGSSPSGSESPTVVPTPTYVYQPTSEPVPTPTPAAETPKESNTPLALAALIGVAAIIIVAAAAAYFFLLKKPK
jgi:hypothetical protein